MKTPLLSALAFGAMTSAALAAPVALSDAEMDTVTAGSVGLILLGPAGASQDIFIQIPVANTNTPDSLLLGVGGENATGPATIQIRLR